MSKYIIEVPVDAQYIMINGVRMGDCYTQTTYIADIEELNSDYINEHFGSLQDDAYKRGLEEGKKATFGLVADASGAEYQRGLNDAWEAAKKIALMDTETSENVTGYFGLFHIMENLTPMQALEKLKAYEEKQADKIKVGDEVNWLGDCFIVTRIFQPYNTKEQCDGIDDDGCVYQGVLMDDLEKTGRHFDIDKILEEMRT